MSILAAAPPAHHPPASSAAITAILSGSAVLAVTVSWLLMRHMHHAPSQSHPVLLRLCIVLDWAAGSVLAVAGLEGLLQGWAGDGERFLSGQYAPAAADVIAVAGLVLLFGTIVALIWSPDSQAAWTALAVPLVLGLAAGGALHQAYAVTAEPGTQLASALSTWLAG